MRLLLPLTRAADPDPAVLAGSGFLKLGRIQNLGFKIGSDPDPGFEIWADPVYKIWSDTV